MHARFVERIPLRIIHTRTCILTGKESEQVPHPAAMTGPTGTRVRPAPSGIPGCSFAVDQAFPTVAAVEDIQLRTLSIPLLPLPFDGRGCRGELYPVRV